LQQQFQTLHSAYEELAVDIDKELEEIKVCHDKLEREIQ
jgi:hypothetical protein